MTEVRTTGQRYPIRRNVPENSYEQAQERCGGKDETKIGNLLISVKFAIAGFKQTRIEA